MRNAVAWSYDLLSPGEQRLFRRLALFAGGCTLEAAEAICGEAEEVSPGSVLEGLTALVDQSLVRAESVAGKPRFLLLEVIREFALEQLHMSGKADTLHRQHALYYLHLAEEAARMGPAQDARDGQLIQEFANACAALEWAQAQGESTLGLRLATACGRVWYFFGLGSESLRWLEAFLALDTQAGAQAAAPAVRIRALYGIGQMAMERGEYDRVEALAREELALAERVSDESGMGNALAHLGMVAENRGDLPTAASFLEQGIAHCQKAGDIGGAGRAMVSLGHVFRALGEYARARQMFEAALEQHRAINLTWPVAIALTSLGHLAGSQGDYRLALDRYRESLALLRTFGTKGYIAWCFEGMATAACAVGQPEQAAQLCAVAERLRVEARSPRPPVEQRHYEQTVAAAHAALGDKRFEQVWAVGQTLPLEEALSDALAERPAP